MRILPERDALRVADDFATDAMNLAPVEVLAVILIGSLATREYVPGRSDIDTAVILADTADEHVVRELERLAAGYAARHEIPKGFGVVPIRVEQLYRCPDPHDELAPELLDLHERGRVLAGELDISKVWLPSEEDLLAYCKLFIPWLRAERRDPARPTANRTVDAEINGLLYELRLTILFDYGWYPLSKPAVVSTWLDHPAVGDEPELEQIRDYLDWRGDPPSLEAVRRLRDMAEEFNQPIVAQ